MVRGGFDVYELPRELDGIDGHRLQDNLWPVDGRYTGEMSESVPFRSHVQSVDDLRGPAGRLEAVLNTGREDALYAAVVAHPHPPSGGTMHTKAVYHAAKAFSSFGIPVLRFNFRSTGLSEGEHDEGKGEVEDVRAAVD